MRSSLQKEKIMKKVLILVLCVILLMSLMPAFAEGEDIVIRVNGVFQKYDTTAKIIGGRTMVPMRGIFKALGAQVQWDDENKTVIVTKGEEKKIVLRIGSDVAEVDGKEVMLDVPATIIDERTMVPFRFVSEAMDCTVEWDEVRREARAWTVSQQILDSLKKYDIVFTQDMIDWQASVYDPEKGGFYEARSAMGPWYYDPLLEATAQSIDFMIGTRLIPKENGVVDYKAIPDELRLKWIDFFQSRQDPDDGYFYDPQQGKDVADARRERNLTKSITALSYLGAKPLYKTPMDRIAEENEKKGSGEDVESVVPEQYRSEENILAWLETLPWAKDAYSAGNTITASMTMIRAAGLQKVVQDYVTAKQNQDTGFWGGDKLDYNTLNAAMKLSGVYDKTYPYPNLENAMESLLYVALNCEAPTASALWNLLMLLNTAKNTHTDGNAEVQKLIDEKFIELNDAILAQLPSFKMPDGGYGYMPGGNGAASTGETNKVAGVREGGVNGNLLCTSYMREQAWWVYKLIMPPLLDTQRDEFFNKLLNAPKVQKEEFNPVICDQNFNEDEFDSTPAGIKVNTGSEAGKAYVIEDPYNFRNRCLMMTGDKNGYTSMKINLGSSVNYTKLTFEMRLMVYDKGNPEGQWYVSMGDNIAIQWVIDTYNQGNKALIKTRNADATGSNVESVGYIDVGEWYNIKIEYIPNGLKNTKIIFYFDDEKVYESGNYFNGNDPTQQPIKGITSMTVGKYSYTGGTLLFDNIKAYFE